MENDKLFLPEVNCENIEYIQTIEENCDIKKSECPCCKYKTIPNGEDDIAFICPVCFWEIDPFISKADEKSDQNHGLTLLIARENFKKYGAVMPKLKQYCIIPIEDE